MSIRHPLQLDEQVLHVHIAVDYAPGIGAGIGIAQETRDPGTGQVIRHWTLNKTHAKAWHYKDFERQDIETSETCQMRAFREGLGMVRGLYKRTLRTSSSKLDKMGRKRDSHMLAPRTALLNLFENREQHTGVLPRKIVINCERRLVVDLINRYLQHECDSFEAISSDKVKIEQSITDDVLEKARKLKELHQIRAALKSIHRISRCSAEVSIVRANPRDGAAVSAKRLARQRRVEICGKDQGGVD